MESEEQVEQLMKAGAFEAIKKFLFCEVDNIRYVGCGCLCVLLQYRNFHLKSKKKNNPTLSFPAHIIVFHSRFLCDN